ncbi:MAG TPA: NAD(P)/FAD-dependent oxidoreductase [Thermoplasmata archaeon]
MRADVLVVGAGPAGSNAARLLAKDHDVIIAEEHLTPGEPLQCAGLVTARGVPGFARDSIIGDVKGVRVHSPLGYAIELKARKSRAYVLDRQRFDRVMFHSAVDAGAKPLLGTSVREVHQTETGLLSGLRSEGRGDTVASRMVVGADGYKSVCRRAAHLPSPKHMLTGIQADLKGAETDPEFVEMYLGRDVAPGFFAWAVPAGDITRVGLCTWDSEDVPAAYLKKVLERPEFRNARKVSSASGKIPIGPGKTAVRDRIMLVGDAACHAKPLSGGGVYTGLKGAELCAQVASANLRGEPGARTEDYDALWAEAFGKELSRAFRIRKVFINLSDKKMDKALRLFDTPDIRKLLESKGDIDYPASLASSVLRLAPKLAQFSPQIIKSFL